MDFIYSLESYHYDLPQELIAQYPLLPRDASRLMVLHRETGEIQLSHFYDLPQWINDQHHLIFNDTKVIPARLFGVKSSGARVEIFLLKPLQEGEWQVLARPGRKLPVGTIIHFGPDFSARITAITEDGGRRVKFEGEPFDIMLEKYGEIPLPHYMKRSSEPEDRQKYQTVYAKKPGASAAPTAGLHFTENLIEKLRQQGVAMNSVTLHTGVGTFRPVKTEDIREHQMHQESIHITSETAQQLNQSSKIKVCVGTTSCRALESAADARGVIHPGDYETNIFIYPGYKFKTTEALITNFHLPSSSLLMLVSAFAGYDLIKKAYQVAIQEKFRFFSYGDAMLIL